jgi:hypothetical protein
VRITSARSFGQAGDFLALGQRQPPELFPVRDDLVKAQNRALDFFAVEAVQFFFDARQDARRAAGADQLDFAGFIFQRRFKLRPDFACRKFFSQSRQA